MLLVREHRSRPIEERRNTIVFDKADILARLQKGETIDDIVSGITDAINDAEAEYKRIQEEEKRAEEEMKKVAAETERVMNAKRVAVDGMLDCLCDYLVAAGEDKLLKDLKAVETDTVITMLDSSIELAKTLDGLKNLEFPFVRVPKVKSKTGSCGNAEIASSPDAIIKAFLRGI